MIRVGHSSDFFRDFPARIADLARLPGVKRVCDLGGGATPRLSLELIAEHTLDYEVVDISADELAKAPVGYRTIEADLASPDFAKRNGPYDLIFTTMVAEHVKDPEIFHRAVYDALSDGGYAFHAFSTLYEPAFVVNRLLPDGITEAMLGWVQPGREAEGGHAKFPAYYRWCRGPTRHQLRRLESIGFEVVEYAGFFGHGYLAKRAPRVHRMQRRVAEMLVSHPVPALTSFAFVVLRRPTGSATRTTTNRSRGGAAGVGVRSTRDRITLHQTDLLDDRTFDG